MYIPYELGDEVYYFSPTSGKLLKRKIKEFKISKEEQLVITDTGTELSFGVSLDRCYPTKAIAKEELLRRAIDYANENLIDI